MAAILDGIMDFEHNL